MNYVEAFAALMDSLADQEPPVDVEHPPELPSTLRTNHWSANRCSPPAQNLQTEFDTIPVARSELLDTLMAYVESPNPTHMLLVKFPPGVGKTWTAVDVAHWAAEVLGRRVMYAGPRHAFFGDIQIASAESGHNPLDWHEWLARQKDQPDPTRDTCIHAPDINKFIARGYPGEVFCRGVCTKHYMDHKCKYIAQSKSTAPFIYVQHQHITNGHPLAPHCQVLIGDENPMGVFPHLITIPANKMAWRDLDPTEPIMHILHEMAGIAATGKQLSGYGLYEYLGIERVIEACTEFTQEKIAKLAMPKITRPEQVEDLNYNVLPQLLELMLREAQAALKQRDSNFQQPEPEWQDEEEEDPKPYSAFPERILLKNKQLEIISRKNVAKEMPKHIIWLDGTGQAPLFQACFKRQVVVIEANVEMRARIIQATNRRNGISSLRTKKEADPEERKLTEIEPTENVAQARAIIDHQIAKNGYQNSAIITHKAVAEPMGANGHFYANRGSNAYQDCDALFVVGTPQPPLQEIEKLAKSIWYDEMENFDNTWVTVDRPYNYVDPADGQGWSQPVSEYADPRLNLLLYQMREAEIVQTAHRARPVLNQNTTIYLLTNLPIDDLPPTQLVTNRWLMDAPEGVNIYKWQQVIELTTRIEAEKGYFTLKDIMDNLGYDKKTAIRYRQQLIESGAWSIETVAVKTHTRGRPEQKIVRTGVDDDKTEGN